ncbi:MAG: glycosyltransferase [bacterium]|nr:glycosyltransferase [bacterium]
MTRVLIVTHEVLGLRMAGPGIRAFELARQMSRVADVTLASVLPLTGSFEVGFRVLGFDDDRDQLEAFAREADVLVLQGMMPRRHAWLLGLGKRLVMDLYDPFLFESYAQCLDLRAGQDLFLHLWDVQNEQMDRADFSICASERQRDMWLGRYCALGRLRPEIFRDDPSFRKLVDVVPFGVPDAPPVATRPAMRGVIPGIGPDDRILLWGGGVWNWFDPLTVIRAVGVLAGRRPDVKLVFMGVKPPSPELPEMEMTARAIALSDELGLTGRHVFFNHDWVPYDERQNYLLEADLGISSHFDAIETRFSFRTRVLDYMWAGLPIVTTEGDSMAELVQREGLGRVTRYGSVEDWVTAIEDLLDHPATIEAMRERVREVAERFRWSRVAAPLVAYCQEPWALPSPLWSVSERYGKRRLGVPVQLVVKAARTFRAGGIALVTEKGRKVVLRALRRLRPRTGEPGT